MNDLCFGALGATPLDIRITLIDAPPESRRIRGGQPASEVDLGFEIEVRG